MAIDLLNSFLQRGQNVSSNSKNNTSKATTAQTAQNLPQNLQVMRAVRALQAGQTIQGEIVSVKGDEVQLAVRNIIIEARLAQTMNLTPGTMMPFQVKANTGQGLSLIPLFTNTAADPNVLKALDMAQLPVNERSVEMVQTLMEKGMPIDKQSIQEMYREMVAFKDTTVRDIVNLHQMKLPVTQENLNQLSLYQNNQHYLEDAFSEIGKNIGEQLESLIAEGKTENAGKLLQQLGQVFQSNEQSTQSILNNKNSAIGHMENNSSTMAETVQNSETILESGMQGKAATIVLTEDLLLNGEKVSGQENGIAETGDSQTTDEKQELQLQNSKEYSNLKELADAVLREKISGKISEIFEKVWNKETAKQWLLEPEAVADKKNIKELYEKIDSQIKQLEKIFEDGNMAKSPAAKVIQNTASNLDFMNQLNQMHAYIQLPLKISDQNAHGELYVFTNKKNLSKQDGKVTALLHLDMEHLGKMDVYVALESKKVSTNFYLEKEEYLDFLEEHMDLLTARLNKRGYTCDIKTTLRNTEEESVMKTIEKQMDHPMMLSMQAFDVRA